MTILKQLQRINKANKLISEENTGNPKDFADKLNVSRSQMFNIIDQFKEFGAPIRYKKKMKPIFMLSPLIYS